MLSILELRHIIESAFLPLTCKCWVEPQGSLQAQICDPISGEVELLVTGISISSLVGRQAIINLIHDIREELKLTHENRSWHR
ncbi:DUF1652 domain-containing protein [Pseudomonas moraviensis]|uniref:DUF1652 domain-containing protein n=1 Tax=Pseudomonas moraviensis TaxID=321662 RepID=A0A7Z0AVP6_9PSED|nr:DUF1652 domain-containing protein [Pseudomonas moraviensis]NYH11646.1 hypothetical protein [Pseudomonas moraviensis]